MHGIPRISGTKRNYSILYYEKPGQPAIKLEQGIGPISITAVGGFDNEYRNIPWTLSLGTHASGFDIAITGAGKVREYSDLLLGSEKWHFRRTLIGYSTSGQIFDIGVWLEGAWNRENTDEDFVVAYDYFKSNIKPLLLIMGIDTSLHNIELLETDHAKNRDYFQTLAGVDYTIGIGNG